MAEKKKYNSILISGRKDQTLTYSKYVKDEESGESVKESLDKKVNVTDELTTQQIKDGAITNEKMAAGSVGNTNLQDGSVSNEKLEDGSITNEKLAENSITKDKLKDNTIGVEKLDPELRQTINAATGLPENLVETIQNVDDTLKDHQSQLNDKQSQIDDKQQQITANDEDISLLQTLSTQMEETIESIAVTGGASQATAVTYNNEKSKLTAVNIQSAVDEVVDKTAIKDEEGTVVETPFRYIQNEEFIFAKVDAEDKLLFGIQWDGTPVFGKTSAVEDRLQSQVNLLADKVTTILGDDDTTSAIDTLKELKDFFSSIDNTQTLTSILANLNATIDKVAIKDEDGEIQDTPFRVIENENFIMAVVDSEDRLLFGIYRETGKPYYPLNEMYHVIENEEYFAAWVTTDDKVVLGLRRDGQIIGEIHAVNALKQVISQLQSDVASLRENVDTIDANLKELLDVFSLLDNEEYLAVEQDAEGKVLSATHPDGSHYIHNVKSETIPTEFSHIEDPEDRMEITKDAEGKIIDYRDSEGFLHFVKLFVKELNIGKNLCIKDTNDLYEIFKVFAHENKSTSNYHFALPAHGNVNILKETFYLTSNSGYTDKDGVLPMMVYENTEENAEKGITVSKFYVKSTLTDNNDGTYAINSSSVALDFYVPKDILEKDGKTYVKSTLQKDGDNYIVTDQSIEVTKIIMPPVLEAWKVDKKTEHQCEVEISFGGYLSGVFNVGIKFQGSSTLYRLKRNLRFTFYNNGFLKKKRKKIGELPESNSYNLKAYYADYSRIKEPIIFRLYREARLLHSFNEQAPWNSYQHFYTGYTGCYINFPVTVNIDGAFYNLMFWGNKKEGSNYMLSSDEDGMVVSGAAGGNNWQEYYDQWEDEMNDSLTESNVTALKEFSNFLADENGLSKEKLAERIYVNDFIDYYIFITVFRMRDNDIHNVILYSGKDKKKFSCFLYDCDLSINVYYDNMEDSQSYNKSIWKILRKYYWKEICDRYYNLREKVLNIKNVTSIVMELQKGIPFSDLENEKKKWNLEGQTSSEIVDRIEYLFNKYDEYFINN